MIFMKIILWLIFCAISIISSLYLSVRVVKAVVFGGHLSGWAQEMDLVLLLSPSSAFFAYWFFYHAFRGSSFTHRLLFGAVAAVVMSCLITTALSSFLKPFSL